jgi:hypothetical protein
MSPFTTLKRLTWYRLLRHLRKARDRRFPPQAPVAFDLRGPAANERIRRLLEAPEPCMIARFGNNELRTVQNHLSVQAPSSLGHKLSTYLRGEGGPWWWDARTAREMQVGAGFYPPSPANLERFARLTLEDCREIDLLGSWLPAEAELTGLRAARVPLIDLEPYFHPDPWSEALRGRKVLVVHPFVKSIQGQYGKREALFKDPRVLPAFELQTFQSVQSIGGDCAQFGDWFQALAWMQEGIAALDFEIAIIGAGAYGMPLAAFIKRELRRKAVHLGGATQILFGIKGRRWDAWPAHAALYNAAWTRPLEEERPAAAGKVEGGCYW